MAVAVSAQVTVYAILPGRGYEQSALILGAAYDGLLIHARWTDALWRSLAERNFTLM